MRRRLALFAVSCFLAHVSVAFAQETGSVSGTVFDRTGKEVAGATVRVTGDPMMAPRTMETSENGAYGFVLLAGEYRIEVEKVGIGRAARKVTVEVARDAQYDLILGSLSQ